MFSPSLNINSSLLPLPANSEGHFGRWVVPPVVDRRRCQSFFPSFFLKQLLHFSFSTCLFFSISVYNFFFFSAQLLNYYFLSFFSLNILNLGRAFLNEVMSYPVSSFNLHGVGTAKEFAKKEHDERGP